MKLFIHYDKKIKVVDINNTSASGKQHWKEQPRVEAGKSEGGEWTSEEGGGSPDKVLTSKSLVSNSGKPSPSELEALKNYKNDPKIYESINRACRFRNNDKLSQRYIQEIDSAMTKSKVKKDTFLYRGIALPGLAQSAQKTIGKALDVKSYQSTSTDPNVASDFALDNSHIADPVLLKIKTPKGTRAINMEDFADYSKVGDENEVLLDKNLKIVVTGVGSYTASKNGNHYKMVMLEAEVRLR